MKKGLLFTVSLAALSLGIAACSGGNSGGGGGSKIPDVKITNKDTLQSEWYVEDEDRGLQMEIKDVVIADAIYDGDLVVTSSDSSVVEVLPSMQALKAKGKGEATITATYKKKKSDSVKLEVKVHPAMRVVTSIDTEKTDYLMRWYIGDKALYAAGTKGQVDTKSPYYLDPAALDGAEEIQVKEEGTGDYKYSINFANGNVIAGKRDSSHVNIGFTSETGFEKLLFKFNENYTFSCKLALDGKEDEYWLAGYGGTNEKRLALQTATSMPDKSFARLVEMGDPVPAESVELDKSTLTMKAGQTTKLEATLSPITCTSLPAWESSDEGVVKVLDGVLVAYKEGTATITASADGHSDECVVTVSGKLNFGTKEDPLTADEAHDLLATEFADGTQTPFYVWVKGIAQTVANTYQDSQDSKTITLLKEDGSYVENYFTVYGAKLDEGVTVNVGDEIVARGYAKIYSGTYEIAPGKGLGDQKNTNPLVISSEAGHVDLTGIEVAPKTATVNLHGATEAQTVTLTAKPVPAAATLGEVAWSTDNEKVTVNAGVVSVPADLVAAGETATVKVTAKCGDFSAEASILVKNEEQKGTVINFAAADFSATTTAAAASLEKDGLKVSFSSVTLNDWTKKQGDDSTKTKELRVQKNSTMSFTGKKVTSIEFVCQLDSVYDGRTTYYGIDGFTASTGTVTKGEIQELEQLGTWEGEDDKLVLTAANHQVRIFSFVVHCE